MSKKFNRITFDLHTRDPEEAFKYYDHFEIHDPVVHDVLAQQKIKRDFGKGLKTYEASLEILSNDRKYVYYAEWIDKEEALLLGKNCQCEICTAPWYACDLWFQCSHCAGCLKSTDRSFLADSPKAAIVKKTREFLLRKRQ